MKHNFTQNDLIRFIYKETSAAETVAIHGALSEDPLLYEQYELLLESSMQFPKVQFSPSNSTIQKILGYSEQTTLETLHWPPSLDSN